jgi:DNA polymerase-1
VLEDPACSVSQDLKYHWQIFARYGIEIHPYDDIMLMSTCSTPDAANTIWMPLPKQARASVDPRRAVTGTGKAHVPFDRVTIEKASEHAAEAADIALRLWKVLKARLAADMLLGLPPWNNRSFRSWDAWSARGISIDRQVLSRLSASSPEAGRTGRRNQQLAGQPLNPGSPKQLGDVLFGRWACRAAPDQDRSMGDRRPRWRNWPNRAMSCHGKSSTGGRSQTALDLHRRAAGL